MPCSSSYWSSNPPVRSSSSSLYIYPCSYKLQDVIWGLVLSKREETCWPFLAPFLGVTHSTGDVTCLTGPHDIGSLHLSSLLVLPRAFRSSCLNTEFLNIQTSTSGQLALFFLICLFSTAKTSQFVSLMLLWILKISCNVWCRSALIKQTIHIQANLL